MRYDSESIQDPPTRNPPIQYIPTKPRDLFEKVKLDTLLY
jgi:hypothetical protein